MPDPFPKIKGRFEAVPYECRCGNVIGDLYYVDGVKVGLIRGGMIDTEAHGNCIQCGRGVHITIPMKEIRKLLAHYGHDIGKEVTVEISD